MSGIYSAQEQERRITHQLSAWWNSLRTGGELPHHELIEQSREPGLGQVWKACFVVQVEQIAEGALNYTYAHLGEAIRQAYSSAELTQSDSPPLASTRASRMHRAYRELMETRRPVILEGEWVTKRGEVVKYRQCLMPFVNQRNEITAILGGMRFKRNSASVPAF